MAAAAVLEHERFTYQEMRSVLERREVLDTLRAWEKVNAKYLKQSEMAKRVRISADAVEGHFNDSMLYRDARSVSHTIEEDVVKPVNYSRIVAVKDGTTKKIVAVVQFYLFSDYIYICALLSASDNLRWSAQVKRDSPRVKGAGTAAFQYVRDLGRRLGRNRIETCPLSGVTSFYAQFGMRWNREKKVSILVL